MPAPTSRNRRERRHPEIIGLSEAAEILDCHHRTLRRWISEGKIEGYRAGRNIKVRYDDVLALMTRTVA